MNQENKGVLFGSQKLGKSLLMNQMAMAVTSGGDWFGFKTNKKRVVYFNFEVPVKEWQSRLRKLYSASNQVPSDDCVLVPDLRGLKLDTVDGQQCFEGEVARHRAEVVILDPWYKVMSESVNSDDACLAVINFLDYMIIGYKITVMIVAHSRKSRTTAQGTVVDLGSQELRGSSQLVQWVDSIIWLSETGKLTRRLDFLCRHAQEDIKPISLKLNQSMAGFEVIP